MALSHHIVVRACRAILQAEGLEDIPLDYAILGDDLVIGDARLAAKYQEIMTVHMGVKISWGKSLMAYGAFEFAKRLVRCGQEYSPVPANLVIQIRKFPNLLILLSSTLKSR